MRPDRTALCVHCGLRQPGLVPCIECGGRRVLDLLDAENRPNVLSAWRWKFLKAYAKKPFRESKPMQRLVVATGVFVLLGGVTALLLPMSIGAMGPEDYAEYVIWAMAGWVAVFALAYWLAPHTLVRSGPLRKQIERNLVAERPEVVPAIRVAAPPEAPEDPKRRRFVGRVQPGDMTTAPSGAEAVAWRVLGRSQTGPLDEAGGCTFEIHTDAGVPVVIEAAVATVDIRVDAVGDLARLTAEQRELLQSRGAQWGDRFAGLELGEATIGPGDRIVVEGSVEQQTRPDGYRGTRSIACVREIDGQPLVIRRAGARDG